MDVRERLKLHMEKKKKKKIVSIVDQNRLMDGSMLPPSFATHEKQEKKT